MINLKVKVGSDSIPGVEYILKIKEQSEITCTCLGFVTRQYCRHQTKLNYDFGSINKLTDILVSAANVSLKTKTKENIIIMTKAFYNLMENTNEKKVLNMRRQIIIHLVCKKLNIA